MTREHTPMVRGDGEQSLTAIEADIATKAEAALRYLARVGAMDVADALGIAS